MGLSPATSVRWGSLEQSMEIIAKRNKRLRIINDSLFIRTRGGDPIYAWDGAAGEFAYVRQHDWVRASPAIRMTEACHILRTNPQLFKTYKYRAGVVAKQAQEGVKDVPRQSRSAYYSLSDLILVSHELPVKEGFNPAGESEIRRLFSQGFTTYKKTKDGDFVPVWDETIFF